MRPLSWALRGLTYVAALYGAELAAGALLVKVTGAHVWRWIGRGGGKTHQEIVERLEGRALRRTSVAGHIHLGMAPAWPSRAQHAVNTTSAPTPRQA